MRFFRSSSEMTLRGCENAASILLLIAVALQPQSANGAGLTHVERAAVLESGVVGAAVADALDEGDPVRVLVVFSVPGLEGQRGGRSFLEPQVQSAISNTANSILDRFAPGEFELRHRYTALNGLAGLVSADGLLRLAADPSVERVDLDEGGSGQLAQGVPLVGLDALHTAGATGAGVQVAVLDSGADNGHPDTGDAVIAESCFCSGGGGCCPGGGTTALGAGAAQDDHGHGTNVTGIVTSDGDVASVGGAPDAEIVSVKVLDSSNSFCCSSDVLAGLNWIISSLPVGVDVDVINMSLGTFATYPGDCDSANATTTLFANAINTLRSNGVLSVVSSMNNGSGTHMGAPACIANAISVGAVWDSNVGSVTVNGCTDATTAADQVACFSNSNASTDLFAPGAPITSAGLGGGFSTFYGTSQASPLVAACAAVLLEDQPSLTPDQLETALEDSSVLVTDAKNGLSFPRLECKLVPALGFGTPAPVVVPSSLEFVEGASNNCIPLTGCLDDDRYQQVFDSSEFGGVVRIDEIRFRRDASTTGPITTSFSNVIIGLSTTSASVDGLSTTFASNQGSDFTVVHSGALTLSSASSGGSPAPFDVSVVLDTPFWYNPAQGNLLLDWTNLGGESFSGIFYDAEIDSADSVSRLFAGDPSSVTGTASSYGLVTQFLGAPAAASVLGEIFATDVGGFDTTGLWHQTSVCDSILPGHSNPGSLYYGQDTTCDYDTGVNQGTATSPQIPVVDVAQLSFNYFLETEAGAPFFDLATVQVSVNGGPFQVVASNDPGGAVDVLLDPSGAWVNATIDVSSLLPAGSSTIRVRFEFDTIDAVANGLPGFHVDDVVVSTLPYTENFEVGVGDFAPTGLWHQTTVCDSILPGHSISGSLYYGEDVSCDYDTGLANAGTATSTPIFVQGGASLEFNYFLDTESTPPFDTAEVSVSVDGGAFQLIASNDPSAGVDLLLDGTGTWENFSADLGPLLPAAPNPAPVEVRFSFDTGDALANNFPGFYVDDFTINLPEPGMALQLGTGLVFLAGLDRFRRRRSTDDPEE